MNTSRGELLSIRDACKKAGITKTQLDKYVAAGYLQTQFDGHLVHYRDILRASWEANKAKQAASTKPVPKYKQKKRKNV